ncbi:hypothetical protein Tco_1143761 [Tanacetum coccineum]
MEDLRESFNKLMDTPLDFSAFVMNRLKVDTLTPELLAGLTFKMMKGSCKSLVELEYFLEEVYKATIDQLDWINPEGQQYPHDLRKPLPLIPKSWSQVPVSYDKHALWEISHWGQKRQQFYGFAVNRESAYDVYSKRRIIAVTKHQIVEWHGYKHLDWITVRRDDDKLYTFKEAQVEEDNEEFGKIYWWEIVRGRPSAATKDHMIYHMLSSSIKEQSEVLLKYVTVKMNILLEANINKLMVDRHGFEGIYINMDMERVPSSCTGRSHCGDGTAKNRATVLAGSVPLHWPVPLSVLVNFLIGEVLPTLAYEIKQQGNLGARISHSLKIYLLISKHHRSS